MASTSINHRQLESPWKARLRLFRQTFATNWMLFKESRIGLIGIAIIVLFGLMAIAHPILMGTVWNPDVYDPINGYDMQLLAEGGQHPAPPSMEHPLGTDPHGRDVLSQLTYGASNEFFLGVMAALVSVLIGTSIAAMSAYFGGFVDTFFMRLADLAILFPVIAFLIFLSALFQISIFGLALVIGLINGFGAVAIVIKSQALSVTVKPYIEAAKVSGGSSFHIIFSHIIPNLLPLSFLYMMFNVTAAIFAEAILSFFGIINLQMSWGVMVEYANVNGYLVGDSVIDVWWLFWPPAVSITALCAAFYFVGRGMDEIVNPRLREV